MEQQFGHFRFAIVKFVPDIVRGEFVNIGIVVIDVSHARRPIVRCTTNWDRVKAFDSDADVETLQSLAEELNQSFADTFDPDTLVKDLEDSSNTLQLTQFKGRTAESMDDLAEDLMGLYVAPRASGALIKMRGAG